METAHIPDKLPVSVVCGKANTFALMSDGTVWACGWNNCGQCGVGHKSDFSKLERVLLPSDAGAIAQLDAGAVHTCMLSVHGTLWACGYNGHGQRGSADQSEWVVPRRFHLPSGAPVTAVTC